jgi:hypothetical protein
LPHILRSLDTSFASTNEGQTPEKQKLANLEDDIDMVSENHSVVPLI